MSCTFKRNENTITTNSPLYDEALSYTGNQQQALDIVAMSLEGEFTTLKEVLDYIAVENRNSKDLSAIQSQDLRNSLIASNVESLEDFTDKLNKAFYQGNIFSPTQASLEQSGIYSPYEIQIILNDIELQSKIKNAVEALNNSEVEEFEYDVAQQLEKTEEFNSFGKMTVLNPYIVDKTIIETLAAPKSRNEFDNNLSELPYPNYLSTVNPEQEYQEMQKYVRAEVETLPIENLTAKIETGMKAETSPSVFQNIQAILNLPTNLEENNLENIQLLLEDIENNLVKQGLDVVGLKDQPDNPKLKEFLRELNQFLRSYNTEQFLQPYADFFNIPLDAQTRVIKPVAGERNYVYSETTEAEDDSLINKNLLKVQDNLYIKVRRQPIEQLYNIVYSYQEGFNSLQEYKAYVEQQSAQIKDINNPENAEELYLLKTYFSVPINTEQNIDFTQETIKNEIFQGNPQYLQNEFIADFNSEMLQQKQKNSNQWKYFYSNFDITTQGIILNNNDPLTLNNINDWIGEIKQSIASDLKQYSVISKQLPILGETDTDFIESIDTDRANAVNYPLSVEKINSESFRVDENNIIAKNNFQNFVRIGKETYEVTESKNSLTLFSKLPSNNSGYNQYNIKMPVSKISLDDYTYLETSPESFINKNNILNKEQRENIISENFDCI